MVHMMSTEMNTEAETQRTPGGSSSRPTVTNIPSNAAAASEMGTKMPAPYAVPVWPDTDVDRRAWNMAKVALGSSADLHSLVARAQEIKAILKEGK
jgi:hypothetical protein